ncbi:MAG: acyl-[ACP]--phospholipid O-acyltransferase [Planctomycetota bacterium]|nr:MAG: acyl-[ACP]--phospholipid O-acyltransferase [Planctomycetota bacterium]
MAPERLGLRTRGFAAYVVTQFLGAFNDNAFKFALLFFITEATTSEAQKDAWWGGAQALFALPFVLFAAWAGMTADRWGKGGLIRLAKLAEVGVMGLGVWAFCSHSLAGLLFVMFLMSVQSTFFGPCKYGFLAETIAEKELSRANGLVQMFTMFAVVCGQIMAGVITDENPGDPGLATMVLVGVAVVGFLTSLAVPRVPAARPEQRFVVNVLPDLAKTWREVRARPTLIYAMAGVGHFFLLAALLQFQLVEYGDQELGLNTTGSSVLVAVCVIGIGVGSALAARWSHDRVELGIVPVGAMGMSLALLALAAWNPSPVAAGTLAGAEFFADGLWLSFALVFAVGLAGGLFVVPVWALVQLEAPEQDKGRFTAFANMVSWIGILASAPLVWLLTGLQVREQFVVVALVSLVGTLVALRQLPYAFARFLAWLLTHSLYRIRVAHAERVPKQGGALLLANHVSWVDALVLQAVTTRRLHYLMYRPYYEWWPLHWLFKLVGCIPVSGNDGREQLDASLGAAGEAVEQGRMVVIFPEGAVTRLGHMLPFRTGYQRIVKGRDVKLQPVHLGGLWGSLLSHERGRLIWKLPRAFPYPVSVSFGEPLPADSPPSVVRAALRELATEAWEESQRDHLPLHLELLRERRRDLRRRLHQQGRPSLSSAGLLARARALAARLRRELGPGRRVAVAVHTPLDQLLAQLALLFAGRVPVVLDPELPLEALRRALHQAECTGLLAEGALLEGDRGAALFEELPVFELAPLCRDLKRWQVFGRAFLAALTPWPLLKLSLGSDARPELSDAACVVFASAGTEQARPVPLSHGQLVLQVQALQQVLGADEDNGVLGVLPTWTVYGQLTSLWFPLLGGLRAGWHPDPSDRRSLARFIRRAKLDALPANPALLAALLEHARPETLGALRFVLCGEAPLDADLRAAFAERFGLSPLACWTASEVGGLITLNTPDVRGPGVHQRGTRHGTVGHPLAGTSVVAVDEQGNTLPFGAMGRLRIVAPGLAERLRSFGGRWGGWALADDDRSVLTDDFGSVDTDGFVTLRETPPDDDTPGEFAPLP